MTRVAMTPAGALFDLMKKQAKISYKELASCILSDKPLFSGVSPASRADDRSWVSRYIVHAPVDALKPEYFADFSKGAMRVIARLKTNGRRSMNNQEILDMIVGPSGDIVVEALSNYGQDVALYRNMLERLLQTEGFTEVERTEIAMVLLLAAGCSANVRTAVDYTKEFSRNIHGSGAVTPLATPDTVKNDDRPWKNPLQENVTLGLLRMVDGYVIGVPHWLDATTDKGTIIGALCVEEGAINDVESDVSSKHLRIYRADDGQWYAEGMGSKNGTVLVSGADGSKMVIEPPREKQKDSVAVPVELHPGDELVLGANTHFAVIAGIG